MGFPILVRWHIFLDMVPGLLQFVVECYFATKSGKVFVSKVLKMYCYKYAKKENMYICICTMHSMYHLNGEPGEYMNALLIIRTTVWRPLTNYTAYIVQWCLHRNGNLLQNATEYMGTPPVLSTNIYNKMSTLNLKGVMYRYAADPKVVEF